MASQTLLLTPLVGPPAVPRAHSVRRRAVDVEPDVVQEASRTIELTRYTMAKMEEHQMAKMGGFPRSRK